MKKNGFVSTALIYSFFITFLLLLLFLINSYSNIRFALDEYKNEIKTDMIEEEYADINLYIMVYNESTSNYELRKNLPGLNYYLVAKSCRNPETVIKYQRGIITIEAKQKEVCYVYFRQMDADITINIYTKSSAYDANPALVTSVPDMRYSFEKIDCRKGTITYDNGNRKFNIDTSERVDCDAYFIKNEADIELYLWQKNATGEREYKGLKYTKITDIPATTYVGYECNNGSQVTFDNTNRKFSVVSENRDICNVYFE